MSMLDIFRSDPGFSIISFTNAIQNLKYVPGRINELGLFIERSIATTKAAIEMRDSQLIIASPLPRGGPGQTADKLKRTMRVVEVPHFQFDDGLMAEEVQGIRAWGQETAVEMLQTKLVERAALFMQGFEVTHELSRLGAIRRLVIYNDGTQLDLSDTFGVTPYPTQFLNLFPATALPGGTLRRKVMSIWRLVADELGGLPFSGIRALCGSAFFDDLIQDPDVRTTYLNQTGATELRTGYISPNQKIYGAFMFGDIVFENYRGALNGVQMVDPDLCHFVPEGVPGLFETIRAPADYIETVNTMGLPVYAKQWQMPNDKGINLEFQTNTLHICTRPRALITGSRKAS